MGNTPKDDMLFKPLCVVTLAALASLSLASPVDFVLPEEAAGIVESKTPRQTALTTYEFLQASGKDDTACREIARDMIKEAEDAIDTANKNLGEVDLGATCKTIHPTTDHEERLKEAKDKAETLQNELDAIAGKQVTMTVDYVPDPEVTHFTSTPEWQAALKEYNDKKAELDAQPAIVDALQEALDEQQKLHTQMVNKCRCTAQTALSGSMAINNDPAAIKQHQDDYSKAKELLCVLDDQAPCQYDPLATIVVPTLPADVSAAVCTSEDTTQPASS